jgi:hypothetical protein
MAAKKNNGYLNFNLGWLEEKAIELRTYVDNNPIAELEDRSDLRQTMNGGIVTIVVATIEKQIKSIRETLKDYAQIIEAVGKLREKEAEELGIGSAFPNQSSYIEIELGWLEVQAQQLQAYIDDNPVNKLSDRKVQKTNSRGNTYDISAATIEDQIRCIRETLKHNILLVESINKLYKKEKDRKNLRGGSKPNLLMEEED